VEIIHLGGDPPYPASHIVLSLTVPSIFASLMGPICRAFRFLFVSLSSRVTRIYEQAAAARAMKIPERSARPPSLRSTPCYLIQHDTCSPTPSFHTFPSPECSMYLSMLMARVFDSPHTRANIPATGRLYIHHRTPARTPRSLQIKRRPRQCSPMLGTAFFSVGRRIRAYTSPERVHKLETRLPIKPYPDTVPQSPQTNSAGRIFVANVPRS
jgi:hypothetical protein